MNGKSWLVWLIGALVAANTALLGLVWNGLGWRIEVSETQVQALSSDARTRGEKMATLEARLQSIVDTQTLTRGDFQRLEQKIEEIRDKIERIAIRGTR